VPSKIICFWLVPTDEYAVALRRYRSSSDGHCSQVIVPYPGHTPTVRGYHSHEMKIERRPRRDEWHHVNNAVSAEMKLDPRWPKACGCGYAFAADDAWQLNEHQLYRRSDSGELTTIADAPAGAMYDAHWYKHPSDRAKLDGLNLVVKTPEGDWHIDGPSNNGNGWTRTGVPPNITCSPSIGIGGVNKPQRMHGWLRNGVLDIDFP
jgi:hypothetical protein